MWLLFVPSRFSISDHHFDLPWTGNDYWAAAEKLVKVLPS